jgi:hypothetical protein
MQSNKLTFAVDTMTGNVVMTGQCAHRHHIQQRIVMCEALNGVDHVHTWSVYSCASNGELLNELVARGSGQQDLTKSCCVEANRR